MAKQLFANNASTHVHEFLSADDTQIRVADGSLFPQPQNGDFFIATLIASGGNISTRNMEIVKVIDNTDNIFTVVRGQENTSPKAFLFGSQIEMHITAGTFNNFRQNIDIQFITDVEYGAKGDGVTDDTAAFVKAGQSGKTIYIPPGQYITEPFVISQDNTKLCGYGSDDVTILINATSNAPSIWGLASHIQLSGVTIKVNPATIGEHDGLYSTGFTAGRYFYADSYPAIRDVYLDDVSVVRENDLIGVNSFTFIGNVADVKFLNCKARGGLNGVVVHWGPDQVATYGDPITGITFHPNNVLIENFECTENKLWAVFLSATYNVTVNNVKTTNSELALAVQAGDVGNKYAPADIKPLINSGIHFTGGFLSVVNPVESATSSAVVWRATGNYEGDWVRVPFKNCSMRNITLMTQGVLGNEGVFRLWDCFGLYGESIDLENITIRTDNTQTVAFNFGDSSGFTAKNLKTNAYQGMSVTAVKDAYIDIDFTSPNATTTSSTNSAVSLTGARNTLTLAANMVIGGTTITTTTPPIVRLYKGDRIRLSDAPYNLAIVSADFVPTTTTVIPVEPLTFAASAGSPIYIDRQIENVTLRGRVFGYPIGINGRSTTTRHVNTLDIEMLFEQCLLYDVSLQNANFVTLNNSLFKRGGVRSAIGQETRAIDLERCGMFTIKDIELGADGVTYSYGIYYRDANCYNGVIKDNMVGSFLVTAIGGMATSSSYDTPDRTNVYDRNRYVAGGEVVPVLT